MCHSKLKLALKSNNAAFLYFRCNRREVDHQNCHRHPRLPDIGTPNKGTLSYYKVSVGAASLEQILILNQTFCLNRHQLKTKYRRGFKSYHIAEWRLGSQQRQFYCWSGSVVAETSFRPKLPWQGAGPFFGTWKLPSKNLLADRLGILETRPGTFARSFLQICRHKRIDSLIIDCSSLSQWYATFSTFARVWDFHLSQLTLLYAFLIYFIFWRLWA